MAAPSYCARQDVFNIGLAAELFRRAPREVEAVSPSTGVLTIRAHGLAPNAPVTLAVLSSSTLGAGAATVPTGLSVSTPYFAQPVSSDLFQLATSSSGSPIGTFSDAGAGIFGVIVDHGPYLDAAITAASSIIDEYARAHASPINANILPMVCSYLAARIYASVHAALHPDFAQALERPSVLRPLIDKLFSLYIEGTPMVGATDAGTKVGEMGAVLFPLEGRRFNVGLEEDRV